MLHFASLYHQKPYQTVQPFSEPPKPDHQKHSLKVVPALWMAGMAVYLPVLPYSRKSEYLNAANDADPLSPNRIHMDCLIDFGNQQVEFYYGEVFWVLIDNLPLAVLVFVCFWMSLLLSERKKMTCGDIWIGDGDSEIEILRGAKFSILLMWLISPLWSSHFVLVYFLKDFGSLCPFSSCSHSPLFRLLCSQSFPAYAGELQNEADVLL